jgi:hypothetical protein
MNTKLFSLLTLLFLAAVTFAEAQQPAKTFKVGWLESATTDRGSRLGDIFLRRLAELGFVEGKKHRLRVSLR